MMEKEDWLLSYNRPGIPRSLRCGLATSGHLVVRGVKIKISKLYFYAPSCVLIDVARSLVQMAGKESSILSLSHHSLTGQEQISHYTFALRSSTVCRYPVNPI